MRIRLLGLALLAATAWTSCSTPTPPAGGTLATDPPEAASSWRQWGGPNGDFQVDASGLAASWPEDGPRELWRRDLGSGYSTVAADDGTLFTMHRDGDDDVVSAIDAADGGTLWEQRYTSPARPDNAVQFGTGPNATPLVLDDRIVTLSYAGLLHALARDDGRVLWQRDLIGELGGTVLSFGYSASPILHDGKVVVLVGGERNGAVALDPADGSTVWAGAPTSVSYATPIAIDVDGQAQIVYFGADEIVGVDAADGALQWRYSVVNQYQNNSTGPIWNPSSGTLWVATQLDGDTRMLKLTRDADGTHAELVWESDRLSIHFWNTLWIDDTLYLSIGSNASILAAVDAATGEILWRERGFEQINFVHAGERTLLLDQNGVLALVDLGRDGLEVIAQAEISNEQTWTAPTLVGTRLYVRDQKSLAAFELGAGAS